jgi:hypothetical protein
MVDNPIRAALDKAAEAVLFNLKDRKGVGNEIEQCDDDIQAENARLRETLGLTVTLFKQIMDAIDADPVETVLIARRDGAEVQRITAQECFDKTRALLGKRV